MQVSTLCHAFNLGTLINGPTRVTGGLLHNMWRLDTTTGSYAVKQLAGDINLTGKVRHNYELSEQVAHAFKAIGIGAVGALIRQGQYLFDCDGSSFLVYPWVNSAILANNTVSVAHAIKIARLLARMHNANLQIQNLSTSEIAICLDKDILLLIAQANALALPFASDLQGNQNLILEINHKSQNTAQLLQTVQCISHADLDQKNVLWDCDENPILIDWESARKINPMQELMSVALDWSGITTNVFDMGIFTQMISAYKAAGGVIEPGMVHAALYSVQQNWINWMLFNVRRSIKNAPVGLEDLKPSVDQVSQALNTILRIDNLKSELINRFG